MLKPRPNASLVLRDDDVVRCFIGSLKVGRYTPLESGAVCFAEPLGFDINFDELVALYSDSFGLTRLVE